MFAHSQVLCFLLVCGSVFPWSTASDTTFSIMIVGWVLLPVCSGGVDSAVPGGGLLGDLL
jgi:hypothetical protein